MKIFISVLTIMLFSIVPLFGQTSEEKELKEDLSEYFSNYHLKGYGHFGEYKLTKVQINEKGKHIHVFPNDPFYSQPFTPERIQTIYEDVKKTLPEKYSKYNVTIYAKGTTPIDSLIPNHLRKENFDKTRLWGNLDYKGNPWVKSLSRPYTISTGLQNRHLMINASHGRYYKQGKWRWQRPYLFCTTEDLLTHSLVYPYLIPMLENAGAVVYTARERDIQLQEVIVDNEGPLSITTYQPENKNREIINYRGVEGLYQEVTHDTHPWSTATIPGFAMPSYPTDSCIGIMNDSIRPFRLGTVRQVSTTKKNKNWSQAVWTPNVPSDGKYAVYVSYATLPNSVGDAHYTIYHKGGRTEFSVNQKMGGGTWVYLGSFDFEKGENFSGRIILTNHSKEEGVVTADAIRLGGGMGQTVRDTIGTSGMPRFLEGARYHAQWSGIPDSLFVIGDGTNDYSDDIRTRSAMLNYIAGGSCYLPKCEGLNVPLEMCIGIHSDAGFRQGDSIYGSMAICTSEKKDGTKVYPAGISRKASFDLGSRMLANVSSDLSRLFGIEWMHREMWDRNYGESRTPNVPSIIFETLSHQNYNDLKYAHDPNFKFSLARSIYKTLLRHIKYLHEEKDMQIQPLPPVEFAALLSEDGKKVQLSWQPQVDPLEPTAQPSGYIVYTREGNSGFNNGIAVHNTTSISLPIKKGMQYDFKVTAINGGGESFPTEILSVYHAGNNAPHVLIVNGFYRLSGPARIEKKDSLGFDINKDLGVPDQYTASFAGPQLCFDPQQIGKEGRGALGYCDHSLEGKIIGGNTFDYPSRHGTAIAASHLFSYSSISKKAWLKGNADLKQYEVIDLILGAEKDATYNLKSYKTFDKETRDMLTGYLRGGGNLFVSGSYIASDMKTTEEKRFIQNILKFEHAGHSVADTTQYLKGLNLTLPFYRGLHRESYPIQAPDIIVPSTKEAFIAFIYGQGKSAGIAYPGKDYKVLATGFPFESISDPQIQAQAMEAILKFLTE